MAKYKICPMCSTKNLPSVLECVECGNDMMGVKIMDDSVVESTPLTDISNDSKLQSISLVRVCECGAINEVSARKCVACGEDISDIVPSEANEKESSFCLKSVDGECTLLLSGIGEHIVGRENELKEYLTSKSYVSRIHAKITTTEDGVFIENLSRANGTYLNNEKLNDGVVYKLCVGDEIGLGGFGTNNSRQSQAAYFVLGNE